MSDDNKRIIDYDAFNELPPNSWLVVDSEGQGTGKIAPIKIGATYEIQDGAHSFTLVGSNGYTHTVDIPYDSVQMSYNDYDALTELEKMDGTNRFVPDCPTTELEPEIWQRVGRDPLTTDEKTVSKAINELDSRSKAVNGDAFSELVEYSKGDYCIYDNAMYTYIADTPSTGSWDALKWELTDIQTEFTSIKSNLIEKASKDLTWVFSSKFSRGAVYDASSFWDNASEIILMVGNNETGTNTTYWEVHYYKNFETIQLVNGYGLGGNTFAQVLFDSTNKEISMSDCRVGGTQINPFCKLYYR